MSFYQVPQQILNPVLDLRILSGRIVLPTDLDKGLAAIEEWGFDDLVSTDEYSNHIDRSWWQGLPPFDWTVAITQGMGESIDWILEPGYELSKKGLIVLDRITFLEPTRKRFFLQKRPLSNLISTQDLNSVRIRKVKRLCDFCVVCIQQRKVRLRKIQI